MQPSFAAGEIEYSSDQQALAGSLATIQSHDALSDNNQEGQTDVQPLRAPEEPQPPLQLLPLPAQVQGEGLLLSDTLSLLHSPVPVYCRVAA